MTPQSTPVPYRIREFRPQESPGPSLPPAAANADLPDQMPEYPPETVLATEPLRLWDRQEWGTLATAKFIASVAWSVTRIRLSSGDRRRRLLVEIRKLLESMGGLWVELGHWLSRRPDLTGVEAQAELAKLSVTHQTFPFETVELLFLKEFGASIQENFQRFDPAPVSADLFSQTHRARLQDPAGEVVVKVLRPDVNALFDRDLRILRALRRISYALGFGVRMKLDPLSWEIEHWLVQATDLRYDAEKLARVRKSLKAHKVYVPQAYPAFCSTHFLTAEYVAAPTVADLRDLRRRDPEAADEWLQRNDVQGKKLSRRVFQSYLRQMFRDNLFNSDLSPTNVMLFRGSRFAVPSASAVTSMDKQFVVYLCQMFRSLAQSDYSKTVDYLFLTCDSLPRAGIQELRSELIRLHRAFEMRAELKGVLFAERSYSALSAQVSAVMLRHGVIRSWQGVNVDRGWANLEQTLECLHPDFKLPVELRRYFNWADRMALRVGKEGIRVRIGRLIATFSEQAMFLGAQLRKRAQAFESVSKSAFLAALFFRALLRILILVLIALGVAQLVAPKRAPVPPGNLFRRFVEWEHTLPREGLFLFALLAIYGIFVLSSVVRRLSQRERNDC